MKSFNPYNVKVGQIWQDNDGRYQTWEPVYKRVEKIEGEYAYCQSYKQSNFCGQPFEITTVKVRIKLSRFKPTNTGYRFVK
jgi:hypothetical protein